MPFFVPPKLRISTPRSQVNSATERPNAAVAFAIRAPSIWTREPDPLQISMSSFNSSTEYSVPYSVDCVMEIAPG